MTGTLLMGIDVGTFSSKGVLCAPDAHVIAEHQVEHGIDIPRPGWAEQDADRVWWNDVCQISNELLRKSGMRGRDVAALAVSALGADLVPLDADGRALRPGILYGVDTRSTQEIIELVERFGSDGMAQIAGHHPTSQSIGPKILWLKRHEPEVFRRARYLCSADTFLVYRLTGEYVFDYSSAGFYDPLFDLHSLAWTGTCREYICGDKALPRLQWPGDIAGAITDEAAAATGLPAGTPVTTGTLDAVAEAISVGVVRPGDLMIMYGTTTFLLHVVDQVYPPKSGLWQTPFAFPGLYAREAGTATTGAATRWFRDNFAKSEIAAQLAGRENAYAILTAEAAAVPPGSAGLVVLPYFSGERTPINDPDARGVIAGLNLTHGRGHLYRALLEATAYAVAHNLEAMRAQGDMLKRVVAVGGGAKSDLLLQIVSDVAAIEQELPFQSIGASYGDAFLAGLATGILTLGALDSDWVKIRRRFLPNLDRHAVYQEYYRIYRDLYTHTSSDVHRLVRLTSPQ